MARLLARSRAADFRSCLPPSLQICARAVGPWAWLPYNLSARHFALETRESFAHCLGGRWLHMVGDSLTNGLFWKLVEDLRCGSAVTELAHVQL